MTDQKRKKQLRIICILLIGIFLFCIFAYVQNNHLTVSYVEYQNEKIPEAFQGYRIVQISDLHTKSFGIGNKKLLHEIEKLSPHIIVLTGDLVDSRSKNHAGVIQFVKDAALIAPVYYITGNHEYWITDEKREALIRGIEQAGGIYLSNETMEVVNGEESIYLTGLEDDCLWDMTLSKMQLDSSHFNLLLAHEPQWINQYVRGKADLVLSGHAHGGQFILPFIGPVYAPGQGFRPAYSRGVYEKSNTTMVVSRGLGNSVIPLRLFNYPEIVCVDFVPEDESK